MKILKFGGTSVGNAENIRKVSAIINNDKELKIVVLSAVSGTTNALLDYIKLKAENHLAQANELIDTLYSEYEILIKELYSTNKKKGEANVFISKIFNSLKTFNDEKIIVAQGEILSTNLFQFLQEEQHHATALISALDFMILNEMGEPVYEQIESQLQKLIKKEQITTYITQGFICRNALGKTDNLKRGGSDYTASIIGAALNARQIEIWTDISGMQNNDPRYVKNTSAINEISFDEAAELAYFGAKILHPQSIIPAQKNGISVWLKNTFKPYDYGTLISNCKKRVGVRAIAAKDSITAIKIKSYRMLMAYGFLKKIFEVFEKYKTAIDMITTSEVAVSLTIDNDYALTKITKELEEYGKITVDTNLSIICLAGNFSGESKGMSAGVLNCLKNIPLRMISHGGSDYNMSLLIKTEYKKEALLALHEGLFKKQKSLVT